MAELIGVGRCPIGCGSDKARYTLSAKQLAVATCNACNTQVFARSDRSDEILRRNIKPAAKVDPDPAPALPADPAPADPEPRPVVVKPERRFGWGLLAGRAY